MAFRWMLTEASHESDSRAHVQVTDDTSMHEFTKNLSMTESHATSKIMVLFSTFSRT